MLDPMPSPAARVDSPPARPLVVFDGDCGFCRHWIERWRRRTGEAVEYLPFQDPEIVRRFPVLTPARCARAVQMVEPDGVVSEGAEAVLRLLGCGGPRWPLAAYRRVPGVRALSELAYRLVARNRRLAFRLTNLLPGAGDGPTCRR